MAYGANRYVAVGNAGMVLTWPDGANWTPQTSPTTQRLWGVAYGANQYVAVGDNGTVRITSPDGTSWTPETTLTTEPLRGRVCSLT